MQHTELIEKGLTQLGQARKLSQAKVKELVGLGHRLLEFCRRHVTGDLVTNHSAACALLACECVLKERHSAALFAELNILVAYDHTQYNFRRPIVAALTDVAALLPSSALLTQQSVVERCSEIIDMDECLNV